MWSFPVIPVMGRQRQEDPWSQEILLNRQTPGPVKDLSQKFRWRAMETLTSGLHMHLHTPKHACMHIKRMPSVVAKIAGDFAVGQS